MLTQPYEISLWHSVTGEDLKPVDKKLFVIGSDTMDYPGRAQDPVFTQNINGQISLSFKMPYRYIDTITGEETENIFTKYITNESRVKLKYDGQWYDFIVKNIQENSQTYFFTYQLESQYVNELSRTGWELVLDTDLNNNIGTVTELATTVLADTDWTVGAGDNIYQTEEETVIPYRTYSFAAKQLTIENNGTITESDITIPNNAKVYVFYSCCASKADRLQFIYIPSDADPILDDTFNISNGIQCYKLSATYSDSFNSYGVYTPSQFSVITDSSLMRGRRLVFSQASHFDKALGETLWTYSVGNDLWDAWHNTEIIAPVTIAEIISPCKDFTNTIGWQGSRIDPDNGGYVPSHNLQVEVETIPSLQKRLTDLQPIIDDSITYQSVLKLTGALALDQGEIPILVNNGFLNSRSTIKSFIEGKEYICDIQWVDSTGASTTAPAGLTINLYNVKENNGSYQIDNTTTKYIEFTWDSALGVYKGAVLQPLSTEEYTSPECCPKLVVAFTSNLSNPVYIKSFEVYEYVPTDNGFYTPNTQTAEPVIIPHIYAFQRQDPPQYTSKEDLEYGELPSNAQPQWIANCAKRKTVSAKQSNRFNILQSICETFECWMRLDIAHDEFGNVTGKAVSFYNYIGQENPIDFVYGIDVNSIQRTIDSKQIVSKLIVSPNNNEFAQNKICAISLSDANPTGENTIFNFDYYIKQGLIDKQQLYEDLYRCDPSEDDSTDCAGYFYKLKKYNNELKAIGAELGEIEIPFAAAKSAVETAQTGVDNTQSLLTTCAYSIWKYCGMNWEEIKYIDPNTGSAIEQEIYKRISGSDPTNVPQDDTLVNYVEKALQLEATLKEFQDNLSTATVQYESYNSRWQTLLQNQQAWVDKKAQLNTAFFERYASFIQEGTWTSADYTDNNLYFYDAQSVSGESAIPKITYNINVMDVAGLENFENYKFNVGDRTHIQDIEFFGYTIETYNNQSYKVPVRQAISVTEIAQHLDDPSKNSIKVQTYKEPFEDLFHRITATVQSVTYARDGYERAVELVDGDSVLKMEFLEQALNDASAVLRNAGNQSVTWDSRGIIVTDAQNTNQQVRIVSGGILLTNDGGETWNLGITSEGISASRITSGEVNTGVVSIMNGTESYFRWDAKGITAYDYDSPTSGALLNGLDTTKGVRFDKFGVYGYSGIDGQGWTPQYVFKWDTNTGKAVERDPESIRGYSTFELTKEGLMLKGLGDGEYGHYITSGGSVVSFADKIAHSGQVILGRVDDILYNSWNFYTTPWTPYWDTTSTDSTFAQVFSLSNDGTETFKLFDDGTLIATRVCLEGLITATEGSIADWDITADGLSYNNGELYLGTAGLSKTIAGTSRNDWVFVAGNNFGVTNTGILYANGAVISGTITANDGTIGGWTIGSTSLYTGTGSNNYIALSTTGAIDGGTATDYRIWVGNSTAGSAAFSVKKDGALHAAKGDIAGWKITNTSLQTSGTLGNANEIGLIPAGTTVNGVNNVVICADQYFKVTKAGKLYATGSEISGAITATSGSFGATTDTNRLFLTSVQANDGTVSCLVSPNNTPFAGCGGLQKNNNALVHLGGDGFSYHYATSDVSGSYSFTTSIAPSVIYIGNNTPNPQSVWFSTRCLGNRIEFAYSTSDHRNNSIPSADIKGSIIIQSSNIKLDGSWVNSSGNGVTSDANKKHNIDNLDIKYDTLFDNLISRTYQYNDGQSNRIHTGFIAQEVLSALNIASLTTREFAGYVDTGEELALRYDEFISLNTWQIQLLKSRVASLEARLAQLEAHS